MSLLWLSINQISALRAEMTHRVCVDYSYSSSFQLAPIWIRIRMWISIWESLQRLPHVDQQFQSLEYSFIDAARFDWWRTFLFYRSIRAAVAGVHHRYYYYIDAVNQKQWYRKIKHRVNQIQSSNDNSKHQFVSVVNGNTRMPTINLKKKKKKNTKNHIESNK